MKIIITGNSSNTGKTVVTCALLAWLKENGFSPCAFKTGPDYIDPMFHRSVQDVACHNLDLFLCKKNVPVSTEEKCGQPGVVPHPDFTAECRLQQIFDRYAAGHDAVVIEGAMGWHDGIGGTPAGSAWDIAQTLSVRGLLVVDVPTEMGKEYNGFPSAEGIAAIFLNRCSDAFFPELQSEIEKATHLPVVGHLPEMDEAVWGSRHLGLVTAQEIKDLRRKVKALGEAFGQRTDCQRLSAIFSEENGKSPSWRTSDCSAATANGWSPGNDKKKSVADKRNGKEQKPLLAVARDEAFSFTYEETLDALKDAGCDICFFRPLYEKKLPDGAKGLLLPGGYPELHAKQLSDNKPMLAAVRDAVQSGLPAIAECGGFLYLGEKLQGADGQMYEMTGALHGMATRQQKLVRFGYAALTAQTDGLLFQKGERVFVHEFHYWDTTENGIDFYAEKPVSGKNWIAGYHTPTLYAGFGHLYLAAEPEATERFVRKMQEYGSEV